ncbi:TolC family protein [soil metagenome]
MTLRKLHSIKILGGFLALVSALYPAVAADPPKPSIKPAEKPVYQPGKSYDLPALLNLALSNNPYTRLAWQRAAGAAAEVGEARAPYYPKAAFRYEGGIEQNFSPVAAGPNYFRLAQSTPTVVLEYLLIDFGRRRAEVDRTLNQLAAAHLDYDRQLQKTIFAVQRAYFRHSAALSEEKSAAANRELAKTLADSIEAKMTNGLATEPEILLARRTLAQADYDLADSQRSAKTSLGELRTATGVPANAPLEIDPIAPPESHGAFQIKLDQLVDAALADRPDLAGRVADLRAREAATAGAKADFLPKVRAEASYGHETFEYHAQDGINGGNYHGDQNQFGAFLVVDWQLFDGFERLARVRQLRAAEQAARADLEIKRLDTILDVWTAYYDVRAALLRMDAAQALLKSSQETFNALDASFQEGLTTITDLVSARSSLAAAQFAQAEASSDYLTSVASLSLAIGSPQKR